MMQPALQDRASTLIARIPDNKIRIIARGNTSLATTEAVQFRGIGGGQLHKTRQAQSRLPRRLAGRGLVEEERDSSFEARQAVGDL